MNEFILDSAQALNQLRDHPDGHFCLTADIHMAGEDWLPLDFCGILEGRGHRISGIRITRATARGDQGFFGCLSASAQVSQLTLLDMQIVVAEDAVAVGAIAGVNHGVITDCTVGADAPYRPTRSGKRKILQGDCDASFIRARQKTGAAIGVIAGRNTGSVTGACSYLELLIPESPRGLCGEGQAQGLWRDVSGRTALRSPESISMRQRIVDYMYRMGDVKWIPSRDLNFTTAYSDGINVVYAKDVPHYGLPYTQKFGPLERLEACLEADSYVTERLPGYSDAGDKDPNNVLPGWDNYLGNDCSGAVFWSWARCCPSVGFSYTGHMIPTAENQAEFGVRPVGEYSANCENSLEVVKSCSETAILEGYAALCMADAIIMRSPAHGHTRLVFRDPLVMRDENGRIDPENSYVPTHEQGVGKGSSGRDSTWQLNCRYTFRELLETGYLPITNPDLLAGTVPPVQLQARVDGPFSGRVDSNYRIICTTVELISEDDGTRYTSTVFCNVVNRHKEDPGHGDSKARDTVTFAELDKHRENICHLPWGKYEFAVSVLLGNGTSCIAFRGKCDL